MLAFISESPVMSTPKKIRETTKKNLRFECVLQSTGVVNKNKRRYSKDVINEGLNKISDKIKEGSLIGELDHPIDKNPVRQITVLYKEASHRILEYGWNGNKLVGIVETLRTNNGEILKNLIEDGVPVGFSFRGMGDLRPVNEGSGTIYDVVGPIHVVTWDAVSSPSHADAKVLKTLATENYSFNPYEDEESSDGYSDILVLDEESMYRLAKQIEEIRNYSISEECINKGIICTPEGVCYLLR
jgi:hypothetical protein